VDAWLDWGNDCDTLPKQTDVACGWSILTASEWTWGHMKPLIPSDTKGPAWTVQDDAYESVAGSPIPATAVRGLYLVTPSSSGGATILAQLQAKP